MIILVAGHGKKAVRGIIEKAPELKVEARYTFKTGKVVWRTNFIKQYRGYRPVFNHTDIVLNWATQIHVDSDIVYNTPDSVARSSSKYRARVIMAENGVPIPLTYSADEICNHLDGETLFLGRRQHHFGGRNIYSIRTTEDWNAAISNGAFYFSKFYDKKVEYRVHTAHGKVLIVQQKLPREGIDPTRHIAWNHDTGDFVFKTVDRLEYDAELCKVALNATKALGLDFGAVDVLSSDTEALKYVVCEVNSSPALANYSSGKYAQYFKWLNRSNIRRDHWDYSGFNRGSDFGWKNAELDEIEQ